MFDDSLNKPARDAFLERLVHHPLFAKYIEGSVERRLPRTKALDRLVFGQALGRAI
jgi:hypothetical protein